MASSEVQPQARVITLESFGKVVSDLAPVASVLAARGVSIEDVAIESQSGAVMRFEDGDIVIAQENKDAIMGRLARLPAFREKFAGLVIEKVTEYRKSEAYAKLLAKVEKAKETLAAAVTAAQEANAEAALPFRVADYLDLTSLVEVKRLQRVGTHTEGIRSRSPSETKWSLDAYTHPKKEGVVMRKSNGGWQIEEHGIVVADGKSANDATRNWYASMGYSTSVSAPNVWGAANQEAAAGK